MLNLYPIRVVSSYVVFCCVVFLTLKLLLEFLSGAAYNFVSGSLLLESILQTSESCFRCKILKLVNALLLISRHTANV